MCIVVFRFNVTCKVTTNKIHQTVLLHFDCFIMYLFTEIGYSELY